MLWQRPKSTTPDNAPPVDLRTMTNLPGRLLFAEGYSASRMTSIPCTVLKVDKSHIVLIVNGPHPLPQAETAVILEVVQQTALLQCYTVVKSVSTDGQLVLRTPSRPHVTQRRRFPRVDLFLSITLRLSERPQEEIAAQMINLSMDGAACVLVEPLSPGSTMTLHLNALGLHPPEAIATVVRCNPTPSHLWVVGLQFKDLTPEQTIYLGKYISDFADSSGA